MLDDEELVSITDVLPRMKYLKFEKIMVEGQTRHHLIG